MPGSFRWLVTKYPYCDGQIAHYKVPRYVKVVSEFPMTVTGKPQKYLMRETMTEDLKLEQTKTA